MPKKKTKEEFIFNSKIIHGDRYDYSKVEYINNKTKVCIICKIHGEFYQTPNDHIGNHNCRKCSEENHFNYNMKDSLKDENKHKPLDFYIINLFNNNESFIKVGISKEVKKRHTNIKTKSGYNVKPFLIFPCNVLEATIIERNILKNCKENYNYLPLVKFPGYKECLTLQSKEDILSKLKEVIENDFNKSKLVGKILDYIYGK